MLGSWPAPTGCSSPAAFSSGRRIGCTGTRPRCTSRRGAGGLYAQGAHSGRCRLLRGLLLWRRGPISGPRGRRAAGGPAHLLRSVVSRTLAHLCPERRRVHLLPHRHRLRAGRAGAGHGQDAWQTVMRGQAIANGVYHRRRQPRGAAKASPSTAAASSATRWAAFWPRRAAIRAEVIVADIGSGAVRPPGAVSSRCCASAAQRSMAN